MRTGSFPFGNLEPEIGLRIHSKELPLVEISVPDEHSLNDLDHLANGGDRFGLGHVDGFEKSPFAHTQIGAASAHIIQ